MIALLCLTGPAAHTAPAPPAGYDHAWSREVLLGEGAVLRAPQLLWTSAPDGGTLRVIWASEASAGLSLLSRTVTFRHGRMTVGPASILRQGGGASHPGSGGEPERPHQPVLVPGPGDDAEGTGAAPHRLVWVEGTPGRRSLWVAPLEADRLGPPRLLAPAESDARAPAVAGAADGEPPGASLAWIEGSGGAGRLVVTRSGSNGLFRPAVTVVEGGPILAFGLARQEDVDYGLAVERTGERTARLWSFRLVWSSEEGPQPTAELLSSRVGLPERDRLDFAWAVAPEGRLYVLTRLTLRDWSVLPAAYLFQMDRSGLRAAVGTVPIGTGSQPHLSWSRGLDLTWIAPDPTDRWQVVSTRLDPNRPEDLSPFPVTAGWRGGLSPAAVRDPQGYLHVAWLSAGSGGGWELLYRTDRVPQTTLLAERLESVAGLDQPQRLLGFLGFFAFLAAAAFLPAQGPALVLLWIGERISGATPSRWVWLSVVVGADLASRVGVLSLWAPDTFDLGAWALTFHPAFLLPPLLAALWLWRHPAQVSTHRGRWEVALFYLSAQVAITAWPFTLWKLAGLG